MKARKYLTTWFMTAVLLLAGSNAGQAGPIIYVDADAAGANNGSSWADAFNYLQDGLAAASSGCEIRVAQGVYKPDRGTAVTPGDPGATFQLKNGVTIKGGYAGFGEPNPDARNIEVYVTILSGDLAGNDAPVANPADLLVEPTLAENSYHVVTGSGTDATAVLDGFTITAGNATGDPATHPDYGGGGVYIDSGSPTLRSCTIVGNSSGYYAGGMLNIDSSPTLTDCIFRANAAERWGAGMSNSNSSPTLTNCTFSGNMTGYWGSAAAMSNFDSDPLLVNCLLSGNVAGFYGGAIFTRGGTPSLINCTFSGNSAMYAGAIYNWGPGTPVLINCILWENTHWPIAGSAAVTYSNVENGWPGVGNINADPLFVDAKGLDGIAGTEDDNLRLLGGSPCLDAANNTVVPPSVSTDLDGNPRFTDDPATPDTGKGTPPIVDMGAYEGPNSGLLLSTKSLAVPEGGTATFTVALAADPLGTIHVAVAHYSGDPDISVASGALLIFNSSNYWHPQTVTLAAAEDGDHFNGVAIIEISSPGLATVMLEALESDNDHIVYVDAGATGANNGTSWEDALIDLQDGLAVAAAAIDVVNEVRVAQAVYTPAGPLGDRLATFQLINGVALKGGYAGSSGPHPNARNIALYETILSGDLNGNDGPFHMHNQENSYNVVTGSGTVASAVLDGFTITGGNANGPWPHDSGGGMLNFDGSPTISRCTFRNNTTSSGGGAMKNTGGSPNVNRCTFRSNWAVLNGGAIYNSLDSNVSLTNCVLKNNWACFDGGGVYNSYDSSASFVNCLFTGNSAGFSGGALSSSRANLTLINCTIAGNSAPNGKALACDSYMQLDPSDLQIANCIIWEADDQIWNNDGSAIVVAYSDVRGGWPGTGNIDADPLFVQNPDGGVDLHLRAGSPCIDAGENAAVPVAVVTDLDGNPRFVDDPATADTGSGTPPIVDMGAYEFQPVGHAPIADAGEDQTVHAWVGGLIDFGEDCGWVDKLQWTPIIIPPPSKLSEALDTHLAFTTSGNADWFAQTKTYYYDGDAAQSGKVSHGQQSWMETVVEGPGVARFYWRVSSEAYYDFLEFYIDGARQERISGLRAWQQRTYNIPSGSHTLRWRYIKDWSVNYGSDCGWVDKFEWEPSTPPPPVGDLSEALDTDLILTTGGNADWFAQTATFYYNGDAAQSGKIPHGQESWMQTVVDGPGTVKFYWKVSSQADYDFLEFYIDDVRKDRISGSMDWQEKTYNVPSGEHTLKWRYVKDGVAEVKLDGSKSSDPDGDPLTYKWSWTVDGEPHTATGVSPTIELPIGQHTIQLVVNDGTQDSSPDTVVITVVGPIETALWIWPTVIDRSDGMMPYVLGLARLPGIAKDAVDIAQPLLLYPGAIKAVYQYAVEYDDAGTVWTNVFAFFDKAKLLSAVPENGKVKLHIVGRLKTGQYFYGAYWVTIVD